MYAGVETGGTKVVVGVGTGPDDLETASFPTAPPGETLRETIALIRSLSAGERPAAIGVASFGPVDLHEDSPSYGHVASTPKKHWSGADVVGPLRASFGVPVGFNTDVNGAALGESQWGATQGLHTSVYVTVGTGIGGGGLVRGQPLHGLLHPEMGHLTVRRHPDDDFEGICPFHGDCLEGLAAGPALKRRWGRPAHELDEHLRLATEIESYYLAQLAAAVTYVLSPQRIVMGGGVMHLAGLLDAVRRSTLDLLSGYVDVPALTRDIAGYLVRPALGDRAGVLGAIVLARRAAGAA